MLCPSCVPGTGQFLCALSLSPQRHWAGGTDGNSRTAVTDEETEEWRFHVRPKVIAIEFLARTGAQFSLIPRPVLFSVGHTVSQEGGQPLATLESQISIDLWHMAFRQHLCQHERRFF